MLGLKRGTVALQEHRTEWEENAAETICLLRQLLKGTAVDIQHVGSTAICSICAKPIIDIAVGVHALDDILACNDLLLQHGLLFRGQDVEGQLLYVLGDPALNTRTHHIHMVEWNSTAWQNYINFRDYCNAFAQRAQEYDALKRKLAALYADDRKQYTSGKQELINRLLCEAREWRAAQSGGK